EAERIHILPEVAAEFRNPVSLSSVGMDSSVLLRLLVTAFAPAPPPIRLLHVDTGWKFRAMSAFRDRRAVDAGVQLRPWTHADGGRRDEEKSRAKERIFSFRSAQHRWDPKNQRPELWNLYNARIHKGESVRVFPLSNWTELDVWLYIFRENIPVPSLYFARERPIVERDGALIMVDDERLPLRPGEQPAMRKVRFRTLGCYPLTGAIESEADTLEAIIAEMLVATTSER